MGRDQSDAGQFEWVNAWAESAQGAKADPVGAGAPIEVVAAAAAPVAAASAPVEPVAARITFPEDQLMRDIADIIRARDALAAIPVAVMPAKRRTQALTLVSARTTDPVPVVVGGVLALVMLTVFGAAAAMTKLAR
jgi:hypothetical protein